MSVEGHTCSKHAASVAWLIEMRSEWQVVFLLAAAVQTGGLVMYLALASGERQSWD